MEKYGKGETFTKKCPKCGREATLFSGGVHESTSGCLRVYSDDDIFECPDGKCAWSESKQKGIIKNIGKKIENG